MNKPIEVGCLVVMIGAVNDAKNIGRVFTVLERHADKDFVFNEKVWKIDVGAHPFAFEKHLIRIDDYDASADEVEQENELSHA